MMANKDYYEILGITEDEKKLSGNAFNEICKKKYRTAAMKYHPDRWVNGTEEEQKEAEQKFKDISEANEILSNPEKREQYDNGGIPDFDLNDIFSHFRGGFDMWGNSHRKTVNKGSNIKTKVTITLEEAFNGGEKEIIINRANKCHTCEGTGSKDGKDTTCPHCKGTGMITETHQVNRMSFSMSQRPCPFCNATGRIITNPCSTCNGKGLEYKTVHEKIMLPKGLVDGIIIQIPNAGNAPTGDGINGDLLIEVSVKEHEYFTRVDDLNLVHYDEVPFNECLLGFEKTYKTIDGNEVKVKADELTPHGKAFIFKGKGMPHHKNNNIHGDYAVVINYKLPNKLTKEQKKKLKDF